MHRMATAFAPAVALTLTPLRVKVDHRDGYSWRETDEEIEVTISLPAQAVKSDIEVQRWRILSLSLSLSLKLSLSLRRSLTHRLILTAAQVEIHANWLRVRTPPPPHRQPKRGHEHDSAPSPA